MPLFILRLNNAPHTLPSLLRTPIPRNNQDFLDARRDNASGYQFNKTAFGGSLASESGTPRQSLQAAPEMDLSTNKAILELELNGWRIHRILGAFVLHSISARQLTFFSTEL